MQLLLKKTRLKMQSTRIGHVPLCSLYQHIYIIRYSSTAINIIMIRKRSYM